MKQVEFRLHNIQSHADTQFSLGPGLNFILADDNNVGKSTVFKLLTTICKMPNATNQDLLELLRVGEHQGYASFKYDDEQVVFWMFREGDSDKSRVRAFFELRADEGTTRAISCPASLLKALDIVVSDDGIPINFNDADSVQLIVQDTPKNDEVLSRVLVDLEVERVKENSVKLSRQILQDYKVVSTRLQDVTATLSNITYNTAVDAYYDERDLLLLTCNVLDAFSTDVRFDEGSIGVTEQVLTEIESLQIILSVCSEIEECSLQEIRSDPSDVSLVSDVIAFLVSINGIDFTSLSVDYASRIKEIENLQQILEVIGILRQAASYASEALTSGTRAFSLKRQADELVQKMRSRFPSVDCPMKGKVLYSEEGCVRDSN